MSSYQQEIELEGDEDDYQEFDSNSQDIGDGNDGAESSSPGETYDQDFGSGYNGTESDSTVGKQVRDFDERDKQRRDDAKITFKQKIRKKAREFFNSIERFANQPVFRQSDYQDWQNDAANGNKRSKCFRVFNCYSKLKPILWLILLVYNYYYIPFFYQSDKIDTCVSEISLTFGFGYNGQILRIWIYFFFAYLVIGFIRRCKRARNQALRYYYFRVTCGWLLMVFFYILHTFLSIYILIFCKNLFNSDCMRKQLEQYQIKRSMSHYNYMLNVFIYQLVFVIIECFQKLLFFYLELRRPSNDSDEGFDVTSEKNEDAPDPTM